MSHLIGQPIEAIPGQTMTALDPSSIENGLLERYIDTLKTGHTATFECLLPTDTYDHWYMVTAEPLSSGLVISLVNITDRKNAEIQARQQADEMRATLDASLNSILLMRAIRDSATGQIVDFRMETANQAVVNSLFKTPDELMGQTLLNMFPGNVESGFFALYTRVADSGKSEKAEYYYQDANGFKGWFEVSAVQRAEDLIVLTFNNITTQREEQLAQQKQAQVLEAILDHSQTAISLHEPIRNRQGEVIDFQTIRANRQALLNWEQAPGDMLTKSFLTLHPEARETNEFARYVRVIETGEPDVFEITQNRRQYVVTIAGAGGNIVVSAVDVTTDRQYRHELEALNRTLQQSNESLQSFAYVASHDLQEPLRKIQAFGDILQNQFQDNLSDGERDMTRRIQKSANRMQQLVKDLLAYSQVTARREPHVPVLLNEVVSDVLSDLEISITEANATIQVSSLPTIPGNTSRLRQLMQNLIVNALKFRSRDRPLVIQISCQPAPPDQLPNNLSATSAYWLIRVADNGMGFDEKYKDRIFQLFQRLHDSASYSGTGIGLAICQRVVESHDGAIDVSSRLGEGTTFAIFLPMQQAAN
ncbi:sensor histidine kinase [Fibrella forsythiae]|uniref:histidine kinase n=1 Tax=Fibrella forsythiae TaxID=2817061 RepID=A0ABS3JIJ7_9BACT|nr:ATP-binding protein [Fibrella forsythiae]MBO0949840.1 PAS domain-containing protein [Fibrella forsythiae]